MAQDYKRQQLAGFHDLAVKILSDGVNESNCIEIIDSLKKINDKKPRDLYGEKEFGFLMLTLMSVDQGLTLLQIIIKSLYYDYIVYSTFGENITDTCTKTECKTPQKNSSNLLSGKKVDEIIDNNGELMIERKEPYPEIIDPVKKGLDGRPLGIYEDKNNTDPGLNYVVNWDPDTYDPNYFDDSLDFDPEEWFVLNEKDFDPDCNARVVITFRFNRNTYQRINMKREVYEKPNLDLSVENIFSGFLSNGEKEDERVSENVV